MKPISESFIKLKETCEPDARLKIFFLIKILKILRSQFVLIDELFVLSMKIDFAI